MKRGKKKNKEVEDCMHYEYRGNLQDGWWKCVLLTRCGWRGIQVECEGKCQFYDEGEKNKHGIVIGPTKLSYSTRNSFI